MPRTMVNETSHLASDEERRPAKGPLPDRVTGASSQFGRTSCACPGHIRRRKSGEVIGPAAVRGKGRPLLTSNRESTGRPQRRHRERGRRPVRGLEPRLEEQSRAGLTPFKAPEAPHRPGVRRHLQEGGRSRRTARRTSPRLLRSCIQSGLRTGRSPAAVMASARSSGPGASRATAATSRPAMAPANRATSVTSTTSSGVAGIRVKLGDA